jgi:tyrosyl-tRNA synthetase
MSKSYGNAIGLTDAPKDIFGKTMSIDDEAMPDWYRLLTRVEEEKWRALVASDPREAKIRLACHMVALIHDDDEAERQRTLFEKHVVRKELPDEDDIPSAPWPSPHDSVPLASVLKSLGLASSSSEARRLMAQGGVRVNGEVADNPNVVLKLPGEAGHLIQVGKRRFVRIKPGR